MFKKDDKVEKLKAAIDAVECDMETFRCWQKKYDKVNKMWQIQAEKYEKAYEGTLETERIAKWFESLLKGETQAEEKEIRQMMKKLKSLENRFDHEFLISREDREFHSTYHTLLTFGMKPFQNSEQKIIFQSEVENLLALLKENLEKEKPNARELCYFYLNAGDDELKNLTPSEKLERIHNLYQKEFIAPILSMLVIAIERAEKQKEQQEKESGRKKRKSAEAVQFLCGVGEKKIPAEQRAKQILAELL